MTTEMLVCPECRARVFGDWSECKFCGMTLRVDRIGGTVHPDDLIAASTEDVGEHHASGPRTPWENAWSSQGDGGDEGGGQPGPGDSDPGSGWSSWAGSGSGSAGGSGTGHDGPVTDDWNVGGGGVSGASTDSGTAPSPNAALVPVEDAEGTWAAGPAPVVSDDESPSGLDPVSWYVEPGTSVASDEGTSVASDEGPSGLDPVSWYVEPGTGDSEKAGGSDSVSDPALVDEPSAPIDAPLEDGEPEHDDEASFDRDSIYRDPEPVETAAGGETSSELEPTAPEVNWQASADAWATSVEPEGKPKGQAVLSREARLLLIGIVVVLFVFIAGGQILDRRNNYPDTWSANVQQVANWVASTRDMTFKHPVAVKSVSAQEYEADVRSAQTPEKMQQKLADQVAMWRALGALQGNPTQSLGLVSAQHPDDGAFYDPGSKKLILRAGTDLGQLRVGAAGALSVALDDQYGDLSSLRTPLLAENPLLSVVAGNAARIRAGYLKTQDAKLQKVMGAREASSLDDAKGFLAVQTALEGGLGKPFVRLIHDVGGSKEADGLVGSPPVDSQQVLEPGAYFNGQDPLTVDAPSVPAGADVLETGRIGAQNWYLLVAGRTGTASALDLATRWAGDSYIAYRRSDGHVCVADALRGADDSATQSLDSALNDWRDKIPGDRVQVTLDDSARVTVVACDPGTAAGQPDTHSYVEAMRTAIVRSDLTADFFYRGTKIPNGPNGPLFTPSTASCLGDQVARHAPPADLALVAQRKGEPYESLTVAAGEACGAGMVSQLFSGPGS